MRHLSTWAKSNPKKAILYIVLSRILMAINAIFIGLLIYLYDFHIPNFVFVLSIHLFGLSIFLYPIKGREKGIFKYSYFKQKAADFGILTFYIIALIVFVNRFAFAPIAENSISYSEQAKAVLAVFEVVPEVEVNASPFSKRSIRKQFKKLRKNIKKELKEIKRIRKQNETDKNWTNLVKILLILLVVSIAAFLVTLVGALSCNLSCNGQDTLAALVLIGGTGLIVWGGISAIKAIMTLKVKKRKRQPVTTSD